MDKQNFYAFHGVCGVYCGQCASGNGRIKDLAKELRRLTAGLLDYKPDFDEFDFSELQKGLKWLDEDFGCPTCLKLDDYWCAVMKCEKAKELKSCLLCDDYPECPKTEYQRGRYPFVLDHHKRVKEVGLEQHLKEERRRAEDGLLLHDIRTY